MSSKPANKDMAVVSPQSEEPNCLHNRKFFINQQTMLNANPMVKKKNVMYGQFFFYILNAGFNFETDHEKVELQHT